MIKTIIEYENQEYQVSLKYYVEFDTYEILVYPLYDGVVASQYVLCHRHPDKEYCEWRHTDICNHPEKYLKKNQLQDFLDDDTPTDFYFWQEFLDNMDVQYKLKFFEEKCYICVHHKHIKQVYGNAIELVFDKNGRFIEFQVWGE